MKGTWVRALQGLALSLGSPAGWLALKALSGADPSDELIAHPGVYLYMLGGSAIAFFGFGWYVGRQEDFYREHSLHDALTGLYNTRYFWRRLTDDLAFARRYQRPVSLLIGDIDFFKRVNDSYGHVTGDDVLVRIGEVLMAARRRGDTVARVGGEEFALILPETDLEEATRVAERLRQSVAARRFRKPGNRGGDFSVTMSFGVVAASGGVAGADLFGQADAALYQAKGGGRNRVVAAAAPAPALLEAAGPA